MHVQVKSSGGITLVPIESRLLANRQIFIEGEINHALACNVVRQVLVLVAEDEKTPIKMFINSNGGDINAGMLIYDVIQSCKTPIIMYCIGKAYSMGALLFCCGRNGRYMLPNSELMLHEPLLGGSISGNASSIYSISESLMETKKKMNAILAKHTGKSEEEIKEATGFDHYFNPQESIDFGLCDKIVESFDELM